VEGKSLVPILHGYQREGHAALCWSVPKHDVVRIGRWKAIRPRSGGPWQLFDLEADGTETVDLAEEQSGRMEEMASCFEQWRRRVGAQRRAKGVRK
jgi:arylsulfatase